MNKKNWQLRLGIILIIVSIPLFLVLPVYRLLDISTKTKTILTTTTFIAAEVIFWSGGLLVGKELFTKYKSYLNPKNWFKKKTDEDSSQ